MKSTDLTPVPSESAVIKQRNNPLHGLTLETILTELVNHYGWEELATRIQIRCFSKDPSIVSCLKFLRKTPWARSKVESLYLFMQREAKRVKYQMGKR